ncbi:MAG: carboxypeptidase regulatory-like domain-containing protein [Okeania sp. SIO2D1]|nr:carboxypeptidase regulatory-like domain-containing protein [Okeania sp. SIO2D1]
MSTVTDEDADYSFDDLSPGTYTIAEVIQPGWEGTYSATLRDLTVLYGNEFHF